MAETLLTGSEHQNELEITSVANKKLFEMQFWAGAESTSWLLRGASSTFSEALRTLRNAVLTPTFPPYSVDATLRRHAAAVPNHLHDPYQVADRVLSASLYGDAHPYARQARVSTADASGLTRDDIRRVWNETVDPVNTTLIVVGDVDPHAIGALVGELFGEWKHDPARPAPQPIPPARSSVPRLVVVDQPHAQQASVFFGTVVSPVTSTERATDWILALLAGRMRSSAVNEHMRDKPAGVWGSGARVDLLEAGSFLCWHGNVDPARVSTVLRSLGDQWRVLRERGPGPDELEVAKQLSVRSMPRDFETVGGLREAFMWIARYGWPLDDLATRRASIEAVSAERIRAETPPLTAFTAVVVGDPRRSRALSSPSAGAQLRCATNGARSCGRSPRRARLRRLPLLRTSPRRPRTCPSLPFGSAGRRGVLPHGAACDLNAGSASETLLRP